MSVVIFGSINMDLVVRVPRLPAPGETLIGHTFFTAPGGKGANQAVACAPGCARRIAVTAAWPFSALRTARITCAPLPASASAAS